MSEPKRIQRKRTKGWRMPKDAVYVGRPGRFGNPFRITRSTCCPVIDIVDDNGVSYLVDHKWAHRLGTRDVDDPAAWSFARHEVVRLYRDDLADWFGGRIEYQSGLADDISGLRGHDLACWCPLDQPCHADVLLEIANRSEPS